MTEIPQIKTILVTGAGGRLGRLIRSAAQRHDRKPIKFVFQSRAAGADLMWRPDQPFSDLPPCDLVIALWGSTSGTSEILAKNAALVRTSNAVALECGATRVIHMSSAAVYGPGHAMTESHPANATNAYGLAKLAMEREVSTLQSSNGIQHLCLRLANVIGADSLAPALRKDAPVHLDRFKHGGGPMRSYITASDLLEIFRRLTLLPNQDWPTILNVAAPQPVAMEDLAYAAGKEVVWRTAPSSAVQEATLDVTRLRRLLPGLRFLSDAQAQIADWQELESRI